MSMSDDEKKNWGERVEMHLLDNIEFEKDDEKWIWLDTSNAQGHRQHYVQTDHVRYQSREACVNACVYKMRHSSKLDYAKGQATEGVQFLRRT